MILDALVIGGGIAGLWIQNRLAGAGHAVALVEQHALGGGQTGASQGILHGGLKYALDGRLTGASEVVYGMPERWRRCLGGTGELDLRATTRLSDACHLWSAGGLEGSLAALLADPALANRVRRLDGDQRPAFFRDPRFRGTVHRLDESVLDAASLVRNLAELQPRRLLHGPDIAQRLTRDATGFRLALDQCELRAAHVILAAGSGNAELQRTLGVHGPMMQHRGLHQVCVRMRHPHPLYGHGLSQLAQAEPELTVTSHDQHDNGWLLYLGGRLASEGVGHPPAAQIERARRALATLLPWFDAPLDDWRTLRIDRAEAAPVGGGRPDGACVHEEDGVITVWPTKLVLAPDVGDRTLALLGPPAADARARNRALDNALADAPRPPFAVAFPAANAPVEYTSGALG